MALTLTKTTTVLLDGLHDSANRAVWIEFDARYRPVLFGVARRLGLSATDAEDVAQETLTQFVHDYQSGHYTREKGRLRSWLFAIARHRIVDLQRAIARRANDQGHTEVIQLPDEREFTQAWDKERASVIVRLALDQLREDGRHQSRTLDAFEAFALRGQPAAKVAQSFNMPVDDLYAVKYRIGRALQTIVSRVEAVYEDGE